MIETKSMIWEEMSVMDKLRVGPLPKWNSIMTAAKELRANGMARKEALPIVMDLHRRLVLEKKIITYLVAGSRYYRINELYK